MKRMRADLLYSGKHARILRGFPGFLVVPTDPEQETKRCIVWTEAVSRVLAIRQVDVESAFLNKGRGRFRK